LALVLDDFHRVKSREAVDVVAWLAENCPPGCQLVVATRADPLLPLASLRAHGELVELRTGELALTHAEANSLPAQPRCACAVSEVAMDSRGDVHETSTAQTSVPVYASSSLIGVLLALVAVDHGQVPVSARLRERQHLDWLPTNGPAGTFRGQRCLGREFRVSRPGGRSC
jgi:hypothetical protein